MKDKLKVIMSSELLELEALHEILNRQHEFLVKNEIFSLEKVVRDLENKSKDIAKLEMERRKITEGRPMREILNSLKEDELESIYNELLAVLSSVQLQKENNEILIRQGLGFSTKILSVLNPDRKPKTYGPYGRK